MSILRRNLIIHLIRFESTNSQYHYTVGNNQNIKGCINNQRYIEIRNSNILTHIRNGKQTALVYGHNYVDDNLDVLQRVARLSNPSVYVVGQTERPTDNTFLFSKVKDLNVLLAQLHHHLHVHVFGGLRLFQGILIHCPHLINCIYITTCRLVQNTKTCLGLLDKILEEVLEAATIEILINNDIEEPYFTYEKYFINHNSSFFRHNSHLKQDFANAITNRSNLHLNSFLNFSNKSTAFTGNIYMLAMPFMSSFNLLRNNLGDIEDFLNCKPTDNIYLRALEALTADAVKNLVDLETFSSSATLHNKTIFLFIRPAAEEGCVTFRIMINNAIELNFISLCILLCYNIFSKLNGNFQYREIVIQLILDSISTHQRIPNAFINEGEVYLYYDLENETYQVTNNTRIATL